MPLTMLTVTGGPGWFNQDGSSASGSVLIQPVQEVAAPGGIIVASGKKFLLASGNISSSIAAANGSPLQYLVTEQIDGATNPAPYIVTPTGSTLDLSTAARIPAASAPLPTYVQQAMVGAAGGVASLDGTGNVPATQLGNAATPASVAAETARAQAAEALLAPKASPTLTGTPTAPTAGALTNNTQIASTAYTDSAVAVETSRATAVEATKAKTLTVAATQTGAYTASADQLVPCDATTAGFTVTLPSAPADKTRLIVKKVDLGANTVTVGCGGTDVFNRPTGPTSVALALPGQAVTLQYAAGSPGIWYISADDLGLAQLDARYVGSTDRRVTFYIPPATGVPATDSANIAATLSAMATYAPNGGTVKGTPGGAYVIASAIVGPNASWELDMTGCSVTLSSAQTGSGVMLIDYGHNQMLSAGSWVSTPSISVRGGVWNRGSVAAGSGNTLHVMILGGGTVRLQGLTINSSVGKYAILVQNVGTLIADSLVFNTASDGLHVTGPASTVLVSNVTGTTGDDTVAAMCNDYAAYQWGNEGSIGQVTIHDVAATSATNIVKVLTGTVASVGQTVGPVIIRSISGTVSTGGVAGVYLGEDTTSAATSGGAFTTPPIVSAVNVAVPATSPIVTFPGNSASNLQPGAIVRDVIVRSDCSAVVNVTSKLTSLLIDGVKGSTAAAAFTALLWINQGNSAATVQRAVISNVDVTSAVVGGSLVRASLSTMTLNELVIGGVYTANVAQMMDLATTTNVRFRDVRMVSNSPLANIRGSANVTLYDGHGCQTDSQTWTTVAARTDTVTVTSGSSTIADTSIVSGDAGKLVVGTGIPANSYVGTVTAGTSFVLANAAGTAVNATANGTSVTLGSQVASKSPGVQIDLSKITSKSNGDQAYNINTGIAGGAGPCVYNSGSTQWRNLATATVSGTY